VIVAAAAAALLVVGGAAGWWLRGAPPPIAGIGALAQEATDSYRVYAPDRVRPVELRAADQGELVRWVSDRLQRPVAVPDLGGAGFRFMGGRVVATPHGPAGLLMYDDDHGTRLVVLMRPMAIERDTPMAPHGAGAVRGFTWAQRGLGVSVVAAAPADRLHPLADEVRRQTDGRAPG
jgi:anti-sigma factor RsiW